MKQDFNGKVMAVAAFFFFLLGCQPDYNPKYPPLADKLYEEGYRIAFLSNQTGNGDIYATDLNGEWMERITHSDSAEYGPKWLWPEKKLIFARQNGKKSSIYEQSGEIKSPSLKIEVNPAFEEVPDWDQYGDRIIFSQKDEYGQNLYLAQENGQIIEALTQDNFINKQPNLSPDGRMVVFTSDKTGNQDIYILNIRSLVIKNISEHPAMEGHPKWSPQGDKIIFYRYENGNADLYSIHTDGSNLMNLTQSPENELMGSFSPDGKYIAYGGIADDNWEIFTMDSDGTDKKRLTFNNDFDGDPIWIGSETFDSSQVVSTHEVGTEEINTEEVGPEQNDDVVGKMGNDF